MEKLELRDKDLYLVNEKKLDGVDADRDIALIEAQLLELTNRIKVLKSYKFKQDVTK